ncbi:hypothetical protein BH20ACT21_BH20ACT21_10190 [soil metagenome]
MESSAKGGNELDPEDEDKRAAINRASSYLCHYVFERTPIPRFVNVTALGTDPVAAKGEPNLRRRAI